ncbi:MAG TPA: hypothetical protein VFJ74_02980 [Gemmatimonadaceae bacterium]|nr:hypothetical protein [Gemmatimonadaceae bacterium]
MSFPRTLALVASAVGFTVACAGGAAQSGGAASAPAPTSGSTTTAGGAATTTATVWPVKTREHVDLWLHGFAMLQPDTTQIPFFVRGYREQLTVAKNRANVTTLLDANRDQLTRRFAVNRDLVGAQFLALYFGSWDELRQGVQLFLQANGDPNRAGSQQGALIVATFAQTFPTTADRDWLRLFTQGLEDERTKFYHSYWVAQQRDRAAALAAVDTLWQLRYRPRLQRFLNNTQQANGDFVLSLPLDGEGRTISGGKTQNLVTVGFPATPADAREAIYAFTHEVSGALASTAVNDNTTPNDKRNGVAQRLQSAAAVRTGYLLLQRTAPDLADGYARYYLRSANASSSATDPGATLASVFPLPDPLREAIVRQLDVVLGGI